MTAIITSDVDARRRELIAILESATPLILEGYSPVPGADVRRKESMGIETKTSFRDLVTVFDKKVEAHVRERLSKSFPGETLIGEEDVAEKKSSPREATAEKEAFWLIDPIDGTTNFSRGYPFFCSTAAFVEKRNTNEGYEVTAGAVWNPIAREMFSAARGQGAWLNRDKMQVSAVDCAEASLFATGFASQRATSSERSFELFTSLTKQSLGVRRDGSAALDLAYVAAGRIDGYWEWGLAPWDTAAGILLTRESQGRVTSLDDGPLDLLSGEILATNGILHKWLVDRIKESSR